MKVQDSFKAGSLTGVLYLVPTPIGNLKDMTYRAVDCLQSVQLILAEDTRTSHPLLDHYKIQTPTRSFHDHSSPQALEAIVADLLAGKDCALISDAGMPLISDPGHPLVQAALEAGIRVVGLPGANAGLTALMASGLPANRFSFYGFFPQKGSQQAQVLEAVKDRPETAIFYESPHRIQKTCQVMADHLPQETELVIARELTKRFESYIRGQVREVLAYLEDHPLKGELVVLVQGGVGGVVDLSDRLGLRDHVLLLMESQGLQAKAAIKEVARIQQVKKQAVYRAYHQLDR